MEKNYVSTLTTIDVGTLVTQIVNDENIILDPSYQRDVIWSYENKNAYIDSVMKGIISSNITFNETEDGKVCIDGKQRCTSMKEFICNEIPYTTDTGYIYFFGPENKLNTDLIAEYESYDIFDNKQRMEFRGRNIPVVTYKNLDYIDEIDIFNRMQYGKKLSDGELIACKFSNINSLKQFNKLCERYIKNDTKDTKSGIIKKFFKNTLRKEHFMFLMRVLYYLNNGLDPTNKKKLDKFIKDNEKTNFSDMIKVLSNLIENLFTNNILNNANVSAKMKRSTLEVFIYCVHKNEIKNLSDAYTSKILIDIINTMDSTCHHSKKTYDTMRALEIKFDEMYNKYLVKKKTLKSTVNKNLSNNYINVEEIEE